MKIEKINDNQIRCILTREDLAKRNLRISDIVMNDILEEAIVFETTYADRPAGYENNQAAQTQAYLPEFQDIVMERITVWGAGTGIRAKGTLQMIHDITVKDAVLYVDKATDIDDPRMITRENVRLIEFAEK